MKVFFPLCLFFASLPVGTVRRTLKNGLTTEEANALGFSSGSEMQVWSGPKDTLKLLPCPKWQPSPLRPVVMSWAHLFFFFVWFVSGLLKRVEFIYELTGQGQQKGSAAFDFYFCWINVDDPHSQGLITVILQKRLCKQNTNAKIYFVTLGNVSSCQVVCFGLSGLDRI